MGLLDQAIESAPPPPRKLDLVIEDLERCAEDDDELARFRAIIAADCKQYPHTWTAERLREMCYAAGIPDGGVTAKAVEVYRKRQHGAA